jgi:hypothetical protein
MNDLSWVTQEMFDNKLIDLINADLHKHNDPASFLFRIPGIYEILSEDYNNSVLEELEADRNENEEINSGC